MNTELLQKKLNTLKTNRNNISEEVLRSKYKKSYEVLLSDINRLSSELLIKYCFWFWFPKEYINSGKALFKKLFKQNVLLIQKALEENYSAQEYIDILVNIQKQVLDDFFASGILGNEEEMYSLNIWNPEKIVKTSDGYVYVNI